MCPICIAVATLFAAVFRPWTRLRRDRNDQSAWHLADASASPAAEDPGCPA